MLFCKATWNLYSVRLNDNIPTDVIGAKIWSLWVWNRWPEASHQYLIQVNQWTENWNQTVEELYISASRKLPLNSNIIYLFQIFFILLLQEHNRDWLNISVFSRSSSYNTNLIPEFSQENKPRNWKSSLKLMLLVVFLKIHQIRMLNSILLRQTLVTLKREEYREVNYFSYIFYWL